MKITTKKGNELVVTVNNTDRSTLYFLTRNKTESKIEFSQIASMKKIVPNKKRTKTLIWVVAITLALVIYLVTCEDKCLPETI